MGPFLRRLIIHVQLETKQCIEIFQTKSGRIDNRQSQQISNFNYSLLSFYDYVTEVVYVFMQKPLITKTMCACEHQLFIEGMLATRSEREYIYL